MGPERLQLFGGELGWNSNDWTAQDDSIRGGMSASYMLPSINKSRVVFQGAVDDKVLGGAGFASQRTTGERDWDFSGYDGIELVVKRGHFMNKLITLVLKDAIPDPSQENEPAASERKNNEPLRRLKPNSTLSYEYSFRASNPQPPEGEVIFIPFGGFKAVYRGREVEGPHKELNLGGVKRMSFMVRSFFGKQSGAFQITILSVAAVKKAEGQMRRTEMKKVFRDEIDELDESDVDDEQEWDEKAMIQSRRTQNCGFCVVC